MKAFLIHSFLLPFSHEEVFCAYDLQVSSRVLPPSRSDDNRNKPLRTVKRFSEMLREFTAKDIYILVQLSRKVHRECDETAQAVRSIPEIFQLRDLLIKTIKSMVIIGFLLLLFGLSFYIDVTCPGLSFNIVIDSSCVAQLTIASFSLRSRLLFDDAMSWSSIILKFQSIPIFSYFPVSFELEGSFRDIVMSSPFVEFDISHCSILACTRRHHIESYRGSLRDEIYSSSYIGKLISCMYGPLIINVVVDEWEGILRTIYPPTALYFFLDAYLTESLSPYSGERNSNKFESTYGLVEVLFRQMICCLRCRLCIRAYGLNILDQFYLEGQNIMIESSVESAVRLIVQKGVHDWSFECMTLFIDELRCLPPDNYQYTPLLKFSDCIGRLQIPADSDCNVRNWVVQLKARSVPIFG
jgi:hypothetical protein